MEKSTHKAEVVRVHPKSHPNADRLETAEIFGYSVCIGKGDFADGELGVYIPPDSVVPATNTFKFIWESRGFAPDPLRVAANNNVKEAIQAALEVPERYRRIKARTLRGVISEGLLMPLRTFIPVIGPGPKPNGWEEGDDLAEKLGITHYNPPEPYVFGGDSECAPGTQKKVSKIGRPKTLRGWFNFILFKLGLKKTNSRATEELGNTSVKIPDYDIDAWQRYKYLFTPGEGIWVTEKIHGANSRFVFLDDRMWCGSHYNWQKESPYSIWWRALKLNPWIETFCRQHPGYVIYGELVPTQKFKYGLSKDSYKVFAFDILDTNTKTWLNFGLVQGSLGINNCVPVIAEAVYDEITVRKYSDGNSIVPGANHIREGVVIRPFVERSDPRFGRTILKIVSVAYLASKYPDEDHT